MKKNILIICWGNIHRSVIAEEMLRQEIEAANLGQKYAVTSRGIQGSMDVPAPKHPHLKYYPETYAPTVEALKRYAISIPQEKVSTPFSPQDANNADIILAVGKDTHDELLKRWAQNPDLQRKLHALSDIKDPHGVTDKEALETVVANLHQAVKSFAHTYLESIR